MKKGMKTIGIIILSFVLVVVAAAVVLPYLISLDHYKGMIEKKLEETLQRDCSLGTLRVTILPFLGAKIDDLVISNPPGFSQTPLLSLETAKIRVKIFPLLFGKKEIAGLTLSHPQVAIEKDQRGRLNIPYMEETGTSKRKGTLESGTVKTDESKAIQGLSLRKAVIRDGKFTYLDKSTSPPRRTEIERIDFDLQDLSLNKKIRYELSLHWSPGKVTLDGWAGPLGKTIDVKNIPLEGRFRADFPKLDGLMQKLQGEGAGPMEGALKADLNFVGDTGSALTAQGEILLKGLSVGKKGERTIEDLDIQLLPEANLSKGAERLQVTATLLIDKTPLQIKGLFRDLQRRPVGKLTLSSQQGIDLGELGPKFPAMHQAVNVKGNLNLTGDFIVPGQGTPLISINATSSHLDIALAKKKKAQKKETKPHTGTTTTKRGSKPSGLDARGSVKVKEGTFEGNAFNNLICQGEMQGGEVKITRFSFGAFQGTLQGNVNINMAREHAPYHIQTKVTGVDANALLSTFTSWKRMMTGTFNGEISLGGAGLSLDALKKNLAGDGTIHIKEGELTWVNLIGRIVQALGGKGWEKDKTTFEDLTGNFTVRNGKITLPNLLISNEDVDIRLLGHIGLDSTVKMEGEAHLPRSVTGDLSGKGWRFFSDNQGRLTIPFNLKGDVKDPQVGISTRIIEQGIKGALEELLQKERKK